jgi:hypothetical protein
MYYLFLFVGCSGFVTSYLWILLGAATVMNMKLKG